MSFREIIVSIRAVNRASNEFNRIQADAEALTARIKSFGAAMAGIGATGTALGYIAHQFGLLNDEQAKVFNSIMMLVTVMGVLVRTEAGVAIAHKVYAAACAFATAVQNALNISYATFLALTGVGIAVILAAAAAMYTFANSMNNATTSMENFNTAADQVPSRTRSIQRSGETETTGSTYSRQRTLQPVEEPRQRSTRTSIQTEVEQAAPTYRSNSSQEADLYRRGVE